MKNEMIDIACMDEYTGGDVVHTLPGATPILVYTPSSSLSYVTRQVRDLVNGNRFINPVFNDCIRTLVVKELRMSTTPVATPSSGFEIG